MIATSIQADDEICALINTAWINGIKELTAPHEQKMRWYGVRVKGVSEIPSASHIYAITRIIRLSEKQATLSASVGAEGKRRYKIQGKIKIEVGIPMSIESTKRQASGLMDTLKASLRGKETENGVIFRNCEVTENAIWADFEYYQIG